MSKIWAIAWKELYTTLIDRNLLLIMFVTPLVLATIMGLAFGGLGSDTPTFAEIPVAIVNLDRGVDVGALTSGNTATSTLTAPISGTVTAPLSGTLPNNFSLNFGEQLANILLAQPMTATNFFSGTGVSFDAASLDCELVNTTDAEGTNPFRGSLGDLLAATALTDPAAARAGVKRGDFAAAVIIPADFTQNLLPQFNFGSAGQAPAADSAPVQTGIVEVYGNAGRSISAGIVRSIVEGITHQFLRLTVTLEAAVETLVNRVALERLDVQAITTTLTSLTTVNTDTFAILGCLFLPGINPIQVKQQPLDKLQEGNQFARVLVSLGSAQAVFFALFTGVFGILSIYEERRQWTLQRMLVSPTPRSHLLLGKLLGNWVVIMAQLLFLLTALTLVASLVLETPTLIWGVNLPAILLVTAALSLCVSGLGVFIVGLARTPEQVQIFGPMVNMALGVLGGSFGFSLPPAVAQISPIYSGVTAFQKLANGQGDIGLNLLVLLGEGVILFLLGTWLFRRRLEL